MRDSVIGATGYGLGIHAVDCNPHVGVRCGRWARHAPKSSCVLFDFGPEA